MPGIPPSLTASLPEMIQVPLTSRSLCWREIPPPLLTVAVLLAIVVSPYIMILLSMANIAPPRLAWLFDKMLTPVKITVDWKLVIAPPSSRAPDVSFNGSA